MFTEELQFRRESSCRKSDDKNEIKKKMQCMENYGSGECSYDPGYFSIYVTMLQYVIYILYSFLILHFDTRPQTFSNELSLELKLLRLQRFSQ